MNKRTLVGLGVLLSVLLVGVAVGAILYTLVVSNTMKLKTDYVLELRDYNELVITSYDWGDFQSGETKQMKGDVGTGFVHIQNVGNVAVDVTWVANVPLEWSIELPSVGGFWVSGSTKLIAVGGSFEFKVLLTDVSSVAGVDYSFDFEFQIVG